MVGNLDSPSYMVGGCSPGLGDVGNMGIFQEAMMRNRWILAIFLSLLAVDLALKRFAAPAQWCSPVEDYFLCVDNPHEGPPILPSWVDLVGILLITWRVTRLWAAVIYAGMVGNAIYSWTGAVPNVFVADGSDGIGWMDMIWLPGDNLVVYNVADLAQKYGLWAMALAVGIWGIGNVAHGLSVRVGPAYPPG